MGIEIPRHIFIYVNILIYCFKFLRETHKLTQKNFAKEISVAQNTISKIENGGGFATHILSSAAKQFGTNPEWLLFGDGETTKNTTPEDDNVTTFEKMKYFLTGKGIWGKADTKTIITELFRAKFRVSKHA